MVADLRFYYGIDLVDVVRGNGPPPKLVLALAGRLPDTSKTLALQAGGDDFFGWGQDRYLMAQIFNAIQQNTRATGSWKGGKAPKLPMWPIPGEDKKARSEPKDTRIITPDKSKKKGRVAAMFEGLGAWAGAGLRRTGADIGGTQSTDPS